MCGTTKNQVASLIGSRNTSFGARHVSQDDIILAHLVSLLNLDNRMSCAINLNYSCMPNKFQTLTFQINVDLNNYNHLITTKQQDFFCCVS